MRARECFASSVEAPTNKITPNRISTLTRITKTKNKANPREKKVHTREKNTSYLVCTSTSITLQAAMVIRTHNGPNTLAYPYVYTINLVLNTTNLPPKYFDASYEQFGETFSRATKSTNGKSHVESEHSRISFIFPPQLCSQLESAKAT